MAKHYPTDHLFNQEDLRLMASAHNFGAASVWCQKGMDKWIATFDLVVREFTNRNVMFACGLEEMLDYLQNFRFSTDDIKYLIQSGLIEKNMAGYLKKLRFTGEVYAMPEGTPFFPGEPILRLTAPLIEATMAEVALLNIAASNIPFLTKSIRAAIAAQGRLALTTGPLRAHSFESSFKACRSAQIADISTRSVPAFPRKYGLAYSDPLINGQHLYIKSFPTELEAMEALASSYPDSLSFMVDTYDLKRGIQNAITVAKKLEKDHHKLNSIFIDSGDLIEGCSYARGELDKNGLDYVKIIACSNLDEYKIADLVAKNIKCDILAIVTELVTVSDAPKLEVIYKLAQLDKANETTYAAKMAPGKLSLPCKKQVFRIFENDKMIKDIIGLDNDDSGEPVLKKVMEKGRLVSPHPSLDQIQTYTKAQIAKLPDTLLDLKQSHSYPIEISPAIEQILNKLRSTHQS